jgi:protein involved in polysaccharide export with SLBB domain
MVKFSGWKLLVGALVLVTSPLQAQEPTAADGRRAHATRAELQALLDGQGGKLGDAERRTIQQRLADGDFQPGDRVALTVLDEPTLTDTFTVRTGRTLMLPNLPEVPLKGVLRSEVREYLTTRIAEYIRSPQVDAVALIRVAVLGEVSRPGFYALPAEMLASDVVMAAGGPGANADLKKTTVVRGEEVVLDRDATQKAFAAGISIDQLNLRSGDQVIIGTKSGGIKGALQTAGLVSGIIFGVAALINVLN